MTTWKTDILEIIGKVTLGDKLTLSNEEYCKKLEDVIQEIVEYIEK